MKNKYLLFAAFMLSLTSFSQQLISTNTTWSGNIFISQQVVVQQGVTLTIAPGTNVSVGYTDVDGNGVGDVKIIVKGRLKVNSNACNPVKFGPYTSTTDKKYWSGITITSNLNNDSIQGIQILNADTALKVRTASTITSSLIENFGSVGVNFIPNIPNTNLFLRNLIIKRGNTGILADSSGSKLQLDWCSVDSCSNGVLSMNSKITMNSCVVKNSKLLGIATMDGEVDCYNSIIKGNYVFGVFNSSGTINVNNCDISLNTLGGILCAGNSLSNVKYSNIQNNIGAQFETTNYKFGLNTSGGYQSIYDGNPIINANYNNILGDTLTTAIDSLGLFDMNSTASGICWASPIPAAGICSSQWGTNACGEVGAMGINSSLIYKTVLGRLAAFWVSHNFSIGINALSRCYSLNVRDEGSSINLGGTGACVSPYVDLLVCLSNPNQGGVFNVSPTYEQDKYLNINCSSGSNSFLVSSATNKAYYKFGGDLLFNDIRPVPNIVSPSFNFQNNNFGQANLTNYFFDQTNQSFDYSGYSIFPIIGAGINLGSNLLQNSNFPSAFLKTSTGLDTVCGSISGFTISTDFVNGATYKWYYNGNLFQNTSTNTYQIPVAGQWSCEIITPTCTLRTGVRNIVIQQLPAISISGNTTVCQGESVTLNASGASNFLWSNGSTQSSITFTPSANTNINLSGNENGCTANTTVSIIVNAVPNPSISPSPSAILCAGGQLQLTAAGGTNYIWSNGSNGGSINVNSAGVYTVTAISSDNCSAVSSPVTVVTVTGISVTITPSNSNICSGQSTTLSANGGSTYNWSNGSTSSNIIVSPNQTTTYSVTGTSSNGCSNSAQVSVTVNSLPTASTISAGGNTTFCAGG